MDISKTYIKMCDCSEIQNQWIPKDGDWFIGADASIRILNSEFIAPYKDGPYFRIAIPPDKISFSYSKKVSEAPLKELHYRTLEFKIKKLYPKNWLPRQNQIQGMLRRSYVRNLTESRPDEWFPVGSIGLTFVMWKFHEFTVRENGETTLFANTAKSFEEIWLKLYMYEGHNKAWDGKQWIKGSKNG